MEIKLNKKENITIFSFYTNMLSGDHCTEVTDNVIESLSQGERKFIFDLEKVKLINSIGVGIIMSAWTYISDAGGQLTLANLSVKVAEILSLSETDEIIPVYKNINEAMVSLK